jgi:serine/threonine-protein kinase
MAGGTPVVICPAPGGATATWLRDDTIVFATNTGRVLHRVGASGGQATPVTTLDATRGDTLHLLPHALPDGRTVLFTAAAGAARKIAALRLDSGATALVGDGTHARYLPDGDLVFSREGALWGARFDPEALRIVGSAVPLVESVAHTDNTVFHYDVTRGGTLVYLPADRRVSQQRLVWIDRTGRRTSELDPGPYVRVGLSPDGHRLALAVEERENTDIWVAERARGTMSRLTTDATIDTMPVWSPDGRSVAFRSEREGPGIFRRDAQGAAPVERLTETSGPIHSPYSWTPDGRTLLLAVFRSFGHQAIASVTPPDRQIRILLDGTFAQLDPQVSPDGRWMAYQSDETGRFEVYVRPYPEVERGRWQVSTTGGASPRWNPDGRELFYFDGTHLLAVPVSPGATFTVGQPKRLFDVAPIGGRLGADYEVSPDGRRFLFIVAGPLAPAAQAQLVLVQHWREDLRARLGSAR